MSERCQECNGTGEYVGFTRRERCGACNGTGTKDGMTDALSSILRANMNIGKPSRHHQECNDAMGCHPDCVAQEVFIDGSGGAWMPQINIGTIIHVYDAGWHHPQVVEVKNKTIKAESATDTFFIPANGPVWNLTQHRWEFIKCGTPVWP